MFKNIIINIFSFLFYNILTAILIYIYSFSILFGYQIDLMLLIISWVYIFSYIFKFFNNNRVYVIFHIVILPICLRTLLLATIIQIILLNNNNNNLAEKLLLELGIYYEVIAVFSSVVSLFTVLVFFNYNFNSKKINNFINNIILTILFWVYLILEFLIV